MKACESSTIFNPRYMKVLLLFCLNGIQKCRGLDLGVEPPLWSTPQGC